MTSRATAGDVPSCSSARAPGLNADRRHPQPVTVVRALAQRGARVLMLRRVAGDSLGGCWELPGGKVGQDEDCAEGPLQALAREFEEECGLKLLGTPRLIASSRRVSPKGQLMHELTYLAEVADGSEQLSHEHDAARWHPLREPAPGRLTTAAADGLAALLSGLIQTLAA